MYIDKKIPNKQKDENMVLFLRRHPLVIVGHWLFYLLLALFPIGLYYFFNYTYPQLLTNQIIYPFLLLLFSLYYLYIFLFFYHAFLDYNLDVWIVTNKRIINVEQKGLFNRIISEHEIEKIQDVTAKQKGVFATLFNYGDVLIQTAAEVPMFIFRQIANPFEIAKTINHLLKKVKKQKEIKQPKEQNL